MSTDLDKLGQERGCDTPYRARSFDTHLTHGCIPLFRHFRDVPIARSWLMAKRIRGFLRHRERAIGALRGSE
jgi:hypothetical protein